MLKVDTSEIKSLNTDVLKKVIEFYFEKVLVELSKIPNDKKIRMN